MAQSLFKLSNHLPVKLNFCIKSFFIFLCIYSPLVAQTTYSFTTAGAVGPTGPNQTQVSNAYSSGNLNGQVLVSSGIQSWTVPANGLYRIEAVGAGGGNSANGTYTGGAGAKMTGEFNLTAGTVLQIMVGQVGGNGSYNGYYPGGGGGGGSFVRMSGTLVVAAGGGGGGGCGEGGLSGYPGTPGNTVTSGSAANGVNGQTNGTPGTNGNGGTGGNWYGGGGGGGYSSNGAASTGGSISGGGSSYLNGGAGGSGGSLSGVGGSGGFGCGAGGMFGGGGGGGYSGGAGGTHGGSSNGSGGGGGGSYNTGANQINSVGVNTSNGYVNVIRLTGANITMASGVGCPGESNGVLTATVFGGTAPFTYTWLPGGSTNTTISGLSAGQYTLIAKDASNATYSTVYNLAQPSSVTVSIVSQKSLTCNGATNGSVSIVATGGVGGYSYAWYPYGGSSTSATNLGAGVYSAVVTDGNNCQVIATVSINQPPPVQIVAFATSQKVCQGQSVTLIGGGAQSYTWTGGVTNGQAFVPAATASYVVTGVNSAGCYGSAFTTVSVNPIPSVAMSGSAEICYGKTATLTASGANTYTWNGTTTGSIIVVSPAVSTIYTVTGSNSFGCSTSASTILVVNALPNVVALPSSTSICVGQSVTFNSSGASTYTWSGGIAAGVPYFLTSTGNYTVTGTNSNNGCVNSGTTTVVVNQLPAVTATGPSTICAGTNVQLIASGAASYSWSPSATGATITVAPNVTTNYTVTGTDAFGCKNSYTLGITVDPLPIVTAITSASAICEGDQIVLGANGATSYTWMPGDLGGQTQTITPNSTTVFTVYGTNSGQCVGSASVVIFVNPAPSLSLNAPSLLCAGTSATLTASGAQAYSWSTGSTSPVVVVAPLSSVIYTLIGTGSNGCNKVITHTIVVNPTPALNPTSTNPKFCIGETATLTAGSAFTFTWMPGNLAVQNITISPSSSTIYTVSGTGVGGCKGTATIQVVVNQLPVVSISGSGTLCSGHEQVLTGNGASTYTWNNSVIATSISVSPTVFTGYSVIGADTNGCKSSAVFSVSVLPSPVVSGNMPSDTVCAGEMITLSAGGGLSYLWSTNDTTSIVNVFPSTGSSYTVWGFASNGCSTAAILKPNVNECTGITQNKESARFEIYPNPNNGQFFIKVNQTSQISIVDIAGRLIFSENIPESKSKITLEGLSQGVYFITVSNSGETHTKKIVIQ